MLLQEALLDATNVEGPYAGRLLMDAPENAEIIPASSFVDPCFLKEHLERLGAELGASDLRVTASLWNKYYNAALLPGILLALSRGSIALDGSLENSAIALVGGLPRALLLHSLPDGPRGEEDRSDLQAFAVERAVTRHLALINRALQAVSGLPASICWGNAGNLCADFYDHMDETPEALSDRQFLLDEPLWPFQAGPNPLLNSVTYLPLGEGQTRIVRVRRTCCQRYCLPDKSYCYTCPCLTESERLALMHSLTLI